MPCEQLVHAVAPGAFEYAPAGHDTHALAPVTAEYDPALQFVHTSFTKTCPTAHSAVCNRSRPDKFFVQFSTETEPTSEDDGAGHCTHAPPFGP